MTQSRTSYLVSVVGSWPRPSWLLEGIKKRVRNLKQLEDQAVLLAIQRQEDAGVHILTDGEQRRDSFYSFAANKLEGLRALTLADLLDHVEDKSAFEGLLSALDVPAFAIKNPTVVGKLRVREPLAVDDLKFLREHTTRAVKVTLPGPYLLSRSSWVKALSEGAYPTREALADDIVRILNQEMKELAALGAEVIQLDEPVLTEIVFAGKSATRTFMCAALAATASPEKELELAVNLINRVVEGVSGSLLALHVCRGNWSQNEDVLLQGPYDALVPYFRRMRVDQFVLELATPRAGSVAALRGLPEGAWLGYGAVNPRTPEIENPDDIARRVREAVSILGHERLHLNPDCGFGTFSERPVATEEVAYQKLCALSEAARRI